MSCYNRPPPAPITSATKSTPGRPWPKRDTSGKSDLHLGETSLFRFRFTSEVVQFFLEFFDVLAQFTVEFPRVDENLVPVRFVPELAFVAHSENAEMGDQHSQQPHPLDLLGINVRLTRSRNVCERQGWILNQATLAGDVFFDLLLEFNDPVEQLFVRVAQDDVHITGVRAILLLRVEEVGERAEILRLP